MIRINIDKYLCIITITLVMTLALFVGGAHAATLAKPAAPKTVQAYLSKYNKVTIKWSRAKNAKYYRVYIKGGKWTKYTRMKTLTTCSYQTGALEPGTVYRFCVRSISGQKVFSAVSPIKAVRTMKSMAKPVIKKKDNGHVSVTWTVLPNTSGVIISRTTSVSATAATKTLSGTGRTVTLSTQAGTKYYYRVRYYQMVNGKRVYSPWSAASAFTLPKAVKPAYYNEFISDTYRAMVTIASVRRQVDLPDANGCTLMQGAAMAGSELYAAKLRGAELEEILLYFPDYQVNAYRVLNLPDSVHHVNGIAVTPEYIYITCWSYYGKAGGDRLLRISRAGIRAVGNGEEIPAEYMSYITIPSGVNVASITWMSGSRFLINFRVAGQGNGFCYTTADVVGDQLVINAGDAFVIPNPTVYSLTGQDIEYKNGYLYVTKYRPKLNNYILVYNMNTHSLVRIIKADAVAGMPQFECESVCISEEGKLYCLSFRKL